MQTTVLGAKASFDAVSPGALFLFSNGRRRGFGLKVSRTESGNTFHGALILPKHPELSGPGFLDANVFNYYPVFQFNDAHLMPYFTERDALLGGGDVTPGDVCVDGDQVFLVAQWSGGSDNVFVDVGSGEIGPGPSGPYVGTRAWKIVQCGYDGAIVTLCERETVAGLLDSTS